jgi:hypothetical protein
LGDYPHLDRRWRSDQKWWRQAGFLNYWLLAFIGWTAPAVTFVVCAIVSPVHASNWESARVDDNFVTKFGSMGRGILENIIVLRPSPDEQAPVLVPHAVDDLNRYSQDRRRLNAVRPNQTANSVVSRLIGERKIVVRLPTNVLAFTRLKKSFVGVLPLFFQSTLIHHDGCPLVSTTSR